ncbi:TetR/AcrR family transcriptional regulator [Streptomyces sp. NBC_00356]|uniref:TetR/AcrR family transcriptional regulator n=1 Tax=Streptomyces sp. NBC_00356 TaxID=2975724 RepID=UPI002E2691B4
MTPPRPRAARCDAEGNRVRIIETASEAFARTPGATLQSIAKAAGVGQGTMYRHFPHREALLLAVYRGDIETLAEAAPRLLDEQAPLDALRLWLGRLAAYSRGEHGAVQAVEAATRADLGGHCYPLITAALNRILAACKDAELVRPDVHADEVLLLVSFLWKAGSGPDRHERTQRMLAIVTDGLRATASGRDRSA